MDFDEPYLGGGLSNPVETKMARMPTIKERINLAVSQAEERLAAAKRAREIFDRNPDLEELLNLMQKSNF